MTNIVEKLSIVCQERKKTLYSMWTFKKKSYYSMLKKYSIVIVLHVKKYKNVILKGVKI